jgi:hypothetical protein
MPSYFLLQGMSIATAAKDKVILNMIRERKKATGVGQSSPH